MKSFFARLRERRLLRKLNKEKQELIGSTPRCGDTEARVRWLNAALHRAIKNRDRAEIERLTPLCSAAREEFTALLASKGAEEKRGTGHTCAGFPAGVR
jgi:hypothetical protein